MGYQPMQNCHTILPVSMSESAPSNRLPGLDAMRFLAVCAVVWIHTTETWSQSTLLARWAVPAFTITSIYLLGQSLRRNPDLPWAHYAWRRTKRLYFTFLFWNVVYLAAIALKHLAFHTGKEIHWTPDLLFGGSAEHLWFLPFLWVSCLLLFPILKQAERRVSLAAVVFVLAIVVGGLFCLVELPVSESWNPGTRVVFANVSAALPALLIGVMMVVGRPRVAEMRRPIAFLLIGLLLCVGGSAALYYVGRNVLLETVAGLGAYYWAIGCTANPALRWLARLGQLAFGVYIVHVLIVECMQAAAKKLSISPALTVDWVIYFVSIGIGLVIARLLRRTPLIPA